MSSQPVTLRDSTSGSGGGSGGDGDATPVPGLLTIYAGGQPAYVLLRISEGALELGRGDGSSALPHDPRMSRRHARIAFDGARFHITDHGSQNGTYLDGVRVTGTTATATARLLRTGDSLFLLSADLRPYRQGSVTQTGEQIVGPALREVLAQAARASQLGRTLHITGESGSGKEGVARAFHAASGRPGGPFVPLNCATIAAGVAERLLFGARRGAFSGAVSDTEGLVQSADGGTLFLDEIAELEPSVQAKLLRVIETREVLALGALRPQKVNLQLCTASHRDLRAEVVGGRFREDLYFRISSPTTQVPPLRSRLAEIPWLIQLALRANFEKTTTHVGFIEACLLRFWPGNVRELLAEVRTAAQEAVGRGASRLEAQHLSAHAGQPIERPAESAHGCAVLFHPPIPKLARERPPIPEPAREDLHGPEPVREPTPIPKLVRALPDRAQLQEALRMHDGNFSATARALGLHRTQLKRLLEKLGIGVSSREPALDEEGD